MGEISVPGFDAAFIIKGDRPTREEVLKIESILAKETGKTDNFIRSRYEPGWLSRQFGKDTPTIYFDYTNIKGNTVRGILGAGRSESQAFDPQDLRSFMAYGGRGIDTKGFKLKLEKPEDAIPLALEVIGALIPVGRAASIGASVLGKTAVQSVIGSGLGRAAGENVKDLIKGDGPRVPLDVLTKTGEAFSQGAMNEVIGQTTVASAFGAARVVGNAILRGLDRVIRGGSPEVAAAVEAAANLRINPNSLITGISAGASEFSTPFTSAATKSLLVFPVVGTPLRNAQIAKKLQISSAMRDILDSISPIVDTTKISRNMTRDGTRLYKSRLANMNKLYDTADTLANTSLKDIMAFDIKPVKEFIAQELKSKIALAKEVGGKTYTDAVVKTQIAEKSALYKNLDAILKSQNNLLTPTGMRALQKELSTLNVIAPNDIRLATEVGNLVKQAMESPVVQQLDGRFVSAAIRGDVTQFANLIRTANKERMAIRALSESSAGLAMKRVDKNFWRAGYARPGATAFDDVVKVLSENSQLIRSPQFVKDLSRLVGEKNVRSLVRHVIEKSAKVRPLTDADNVIITRYQMRPGHAAGDVKNPLDKSLVKRDNVNVVEFDPTPLRSLLGMDGASSKGSPAAVNWLLRKSGLDPTELRKFLDVAERNKNTYVTDPATFLQRRLILTGGGLAGGGFLLGKASGADDQTSLGLSAIVLGAFVMSGRAFSRLLADPRGIRLLREGLDPRLISEAGKSGYRRQALANLAYRLGKLGLNVEGGEFEGLDLGAIDPNAPSVNVPDVGINPPGRKSIEQYFNDARQ